MNFSFMYSHINEVYNKKFGAMGIVVLLLEQFANVCKQVDDVCAVVCVICS